MLGMPRYRREYVPGGTSFFTINLLERRRCLLVEHVDDLRASFLAAWLAQPFEVIAWCCRSICTACGVYRKASNSSMTARRQFMKPLCRQS
jgi:hypothetical protein